MGAAGKGDGMEGQGEGRVEWSELELGRGM